MALRLAMASMAGYGGRAGAGNVVKLGSLTGDRACRVWCGVTGCCW